MTSIRDIDARDLERVLAINNASAREVNALTREQLQASIAVAAAARIVDDAGFVIAFDESTPIQGPNHAWFVDRERTFVYVDRIAIAADARGRGLARALYDDLFARAAGRIVCCEVNVAPPNPESLAFHAKLGFSTRGEAIDPRNGKTVRYLSRVTDDLK